MHVCARCGRGIRATAVDPVVSAPSLGKGLYHAECAERQWRGSANTNPPTEDEIDAIADLAIGMLEDTDE